MAMILFVIGYMGSGKSTVGRQLAEKLNMDFTDLDAFIENKAQKTISEVFAEKGEIYFRKLEREALLEQFKTENCVIAVGGGTPCYYDNMDLMNQNGKTIYLRGGVGTLASRLISEKKNRPMISHLPDDEIPEFIAKHLFERSGFYNKAQLIVDIEKLEVNELVKKLR